MTAYLRCPSCRSCSTKVHYYGDTCASCQLAAMSDAKLLAAIRRGDVSPVRATFPSFTYWERDDLLRAEARRRGIL